MKPLLPLLFVILALLACGRFRADSNSGTNADQRASSPTPRPIVKVVDIPAIFGKPVAEVKKAVNGKITYESAETIDYEFPQGSLNVDTRKSVDQRIGFRIEDHTTGTYQSFYADSPQQVADFVGIDLRTDKPSSSSDFSVEYEKEFNGKPVRISFLRKESGKDKYDSVAVELKK